MHETRPRTIDDAVLRTVAYGDIFAAPVRLDELHRYLEVAATPAEVRVAVERLAPDHLDTEGDLVVLAGRRDLLAVRRRREAVAARLWKPARRWGRRIGRAPWTRMVAVTGALAMDNVDDGSDIDYLVVAEPGRVWLARCWIVQMVRVARRLDRVVLCPNWIMGADAVELEHRDLFAARELAQMAPVVGLDEYRRMRAANRWADRYLPNAAGPPEVPTPDEPSLNAVSGIAERTLGGSVGSWLERLERRRKTREIERRGDDNPEVVLDERQCKGHVDAHGQRIAREWRRRLQSLPDLHDRSSVPPERSPSDGS